MRRFEHKVIDADDIDRNRRGDDGYPIPHTRPGDEGWRVVGVVNSLRIVLEREVSA